MQSYETQSEEDRLEVATMNIVKKMLVNEPDLKGQLNKEQADMDNEICIDLTLGSYLDDDEVHSLIDVILNASSEYFNFRFPELKSLNVAERRELAKNLEDHAQKCRHCVLKIEYSEDWQIKVDRARDIVFEDSTDIPKDSDNSRKNGAGAEMSGIKKKIAKFFSTAS